MNVFEILISRIIQYPAWIDLPPETFREKLQNGQKGT